MKKNLDHNHSLIFESQDQDTFNSSFTVFALVALTQTLNKLKPQHSRVFSCNAQHLQIGPQGLMDTSQWDTQKMQTRSQQPPMKRHVQATCLAPHENLSRGRNDSSFSEMAGSCLNNEIIPLSCCSLPC